jgi:Coenzyme F420-reducing hydrogenase, delta subunit
MTGAVDFPLAHPTKNFEEQRMRMTDKKLKIYIFYCSNNFNIDEFNTLFSQKTGDEHKIISLPCAGKADILYFLKAFETGADGLVLISCSRNECRYLEGNLRAPRRAQKVNKILEEIGMGNERIVVLCTNGGGIESIVSKVTEFRDKIRNMALNLQNNPIAKTAVNASRF